jgi:hypothetical protein
MPAFETNVRNTRSRRLSAWIAVFSKCPVRQPLNFWLWKFQKVFFYQRVARYFFASSSNDCARLSPPPVMSFASRCDPLWHGTMATRRAAGRVRRCDGRSVQGNAWRREWNVCLASTIGCPAPAMSGGAGLPIRS